MPLFLRPPLYWDGEDIYKSSISLQLGKVIISIHIYMITFTLVAWQSVEFPARMAVPAEFKCEYPPPQKINHQFTRFTVRGNSRGIILNVALICRRVESEVQNKYLGTFEYYLFSSYLHHNLEANAYIQRLSLTDKALD